MAIFYEIDFLDVSQRRSGDAIPLRYQTADGEYIHVVDGGFQATGEKVVDHINKYYGNPRFIDHVVATHPDGDHAGGLRSVLEEFEVGALWMGRPWLYADTLIHRFSKFTSVENLRKRLKEIYTNIAALEEIAEDRGIPIYDPFTGVDIGAFTVVSPTLEHYLDMVVTSERTPEAVKIEEEERAIKGGFIDLIRKAANYVRAAWGEEIFSTEETSAENEMSVMQYAYLCDHRILLTGDAGRKSLEMAADYVESCGLDLPGLDKFQVPHHGSRRNVSSELLDRWLGSKVPRGTEPSFTSIVSAAEEDEDHPRHAVVRACIHRGGRVDSTKGRSLRTSKNAPDREGWGPSKPLPYPEDQED